MKVIPYPGLRAAIPAMALVAANVTVLLGPTVQLAAVLAVFVFFVPYLKIDLRTSWILLAYIMISLLIGVSHYGAHQAIMKAGKLALFCLASVLAVKGVDNDKTFPALIALRAFLGLCAVNFAFAAATGNEIFRADFFIEFSIYSAYTIALLTYLARPRLTLLDRGFGLLFILLCGSTMGLFVLILAEIVGRKWKPRLIFAAIAATPFAFVILNFLMKARGKEFSLDYFATSDRVRLVTTFYETIVPTFTLPDWVFGLGAGKPLHQFITPDRGFNGYLIRLGEGEIYSFCLHNEALRILCDFGLFGLLLVALRLWTNCGKPVLFLLGVCMLTNSYLYSFSGALIASSIFNANPKKRTKPVESCEPQKPSPSLAIHA